MTHLTLFWPLPIFAPRHMELPVRPALKSKVCPTLRLRATSPLNRSRFAEMAGNIIPAIATTNAVIAGYIVMRATNILQDNWTRCTNVYLRGDPARLIAPIALQPPEKDCGVCSDIYIPLACDVQKLTLGTFVSEIVKSWLGWKEVDIVVYEDKRLLADPDFEDNYGRSLADLGLARGKTLTVSDEDNHYHNVNFSICEL
jgi:ubiquitin-like 1-activating enzyme E1 B